MLPVCVNSQRGRVCLPHWTVAGCEGKGRQRQMFTRHRDVCRRVWWFLFNWLGGWRQSYASAQLQGGQEAPAQDHHHVHLPLRAAVCSTLRLSASARIKLLCRAVMQHLPEPQAASGTGHSFWKATPCHLLGHPCSAAAGSISQPSSPRRLGQSQAMKGQLPLSLYCSLTLPANKTVNLEHGLCHTKGKGQCDLHVSHPPVLW